MKNKFAILSTGILAIMTSMMICPPSKAQVLGLPVPERGFISATPGETWEQGLLSGNGTIGANVFGQPADETIIFTHHRMFLPTGAPVVPPDTASRLFEVRQLIDRGLYKQATQLAFNLSGQDGFMYPDPFVPAFDLRITMPARGEVRDYARSVDFQTGQATVHWADDRGVFERRLFVSRADGVAVLLITGPGKGSVDCVLELAARNPEPKLGEKTVTQSAEVFKSHVSNIVATADATHLTFSSAFTKAYPGSIHRLEGAVRVIAPGGQVMADGSKMIIKGADQALAFISIEPIYDPDRPQIEPMKKALDDLPTDYARLLERHAAIHGGMFNRMRLDLGGGADHRLTTEELLARSTSENLSRALTEKVFDAGRYNIISCTGELPPTLQGVWAGTYVPSWASDFTQNGNVPSAIAGMLPGNTPELMLAYTSYIESIVPYLRVNARHIFGARGIVLPSRSTTHGYNNALAPNFAGGMWVAGAPWAARFFYDYYLYTGDRKFLAEHALPFMQEAALFFEDYLYEGPDGKFVFNPTTSPENAPRNTRSQGTFNATMDVAAAKELLTNLIAASRELGVNAQKIPVWQKMLGRMPGYMISDAGVVKEWLTPKLEDNLDHRHSSHLYPLYYSMPDEIAADPKLQAAFRKIVEIKMENHYRKAGFMSFGVVQLGQAAATLGEGELAYQAILRLVNSYWLSNLASMHNHRSLLNMDISGGLPSVLIQMLVASAPGKVRLLPALPKAWPTGTIEGALCRGQIEVRQLTWAPGRIRVSLLSGREQTIELSVPATIQKITATSGTAKIAPAADDRARKITLPQGRAVTLEIVMP
ncbi:MAG: glycoside hydrolase N-terminal domain-containing protein [Candidatus Sumerlaeota bacterium]|nr:glycoside hydrolase N-terminal domain-containing protein [Candidatus Sumerlaeota bacterium]